MAAVAAAAARQERPAGHTTGVAGRPARLTPSADAGERRAARATETWHEAKKHVPRLVPRFVPRLVTGHVLRHEGSGAAARHEAEHVAEGECHRKTTRATAEKRHCYGARGPPAAIEEHRRYKGMKSSATVEGVTFDDRKE